jgi:hypothetical protein
MINDIVVHHSFGDRIVTLADGVRLLALFTPDAPMTKRMVEFFTVNIHNPHMRKAYARAAVEFAEWCAQQGIGRLREVQPVYVAA